MFLFNSLFLTLWGHLLSYHKVSTQPLKGEAMSFSIIFPELKGHFPIFYRVRCSDFLFIKAQSNRSFACCISASALDASVLSSLLTI